MAENLHCKAKNRPGAERSEAAEDVLRMSGLGQCRDGRRQREGARALSAWLHTILSKLGAQAEGGAANLQSNLANSRCASPSYR